MDQRRLLSFMALSMLIMIGWQGLVMPALFPNAVRQKKVEREANGAADADPGQMELVQAPADALEPLNRLPMHQAKPDAIAPVPSIATFPRQNISIGSPDPESGYVLAVETTSTGAAVNKIELNDPRYREARNRQAALRVVGHNPKTDLKTFNTSVPGIDVQLLGQKRSLATVDWELVPGSMSQESVQFRYVAPDGTLEVTKTYRVVAIPAHRLNERRIRDRLTDPYLLTLVVGVRNKSATPLKTGYELQGPVGVPLEDPDNSTKFRDIRIGFLQSDAATVDVAQLASSDAADKFKRDALEVWRRPLAFIGVDVQYFAALIRPPGNQVKTLTVASSTAQVTELHREPQKSDLSVSLQSVEVALAPAGQAGDFVTHEYQMFAGPKRQELLAPLKADSIVDFGWFSAICIGMLWILNSLHSLGVNYGVAIILLTVIVRGALFPFTRKQADNMQRMKELQPYIKELQAKHKDDREGMARAQMELFSKYGVNPLSGCLPLLLQMPIFFGLYRALNSSVDLRMASWLWIDNLAAPDALFQLPFVVPWFNWTEFNLLPIITIVLFLVQQKAMMPPPTDPEQELQQKMMTYMMVFMGVMFYRVPAGLCIYFIASSLWGMAERWALGKMRGDQPLLVEKKANPNKPPSAFSKFWEQMQSAADKQSQAARAPESATSTRSKSKR